MTTLALAGWTAVPALGVVVPDEGHVGWADAAFWCATLEAWGFPFERLGAVVEGERLSTLVVPAACVDAEATGTLERLRGSILIGPPSPAAACLSSIRVPGSAGSLDRTTIDTAVDTALWALGEAARGTGLISVWPWPNRKRAALVVDGDVDHPTGVDPECARYVAPSIETARRANFGAYGIFVAAQNIEAEPSSFPIGADYYNHSFSHPYSYWNEEPWEALDHDAMRREIARARDLYRDRLDTDDRGLFRLPHFQLEAWDRTADVLEELGYRAESSIGANVSITAGLPFHPSRVPWSSHTQDAAFARTHPEPGKRRSFLQIPISSDPSDLSFPHGCCSYNTLDEGVRRRSADPDAFEEVLTTVLNVAHERAGLAHLFIDPPDAGYGRLPGDRRDYASAVERFLYDASSRDDLAIMTTAQLVDWWLAREGAIARMRMRLDGSTLVVTIDDPPPGTTLEVVAPGGERSLREMGPVAV